MHFKGVELTKQKTVKYCSDNTCINLIPICCLFITPECSDNSSKWYHISAGEHVCSACYNHLQSFFSYENENSGINSWKEAWLAQSHETPSINDYITSTLLPNWFLCCECGKWRQVSRDVNLKPSEIYQFCCKLILKHNRNPCNIVEDHRIEFIRNHPASFFDSLKYTVYLDSSPYLNVYDEYSLDTIGISPTAHKLDFGLEEPCEGFMTVFNPFLKEQNLQTIAGAIDATSMDKWEYGFFPTFTGNLRNIFIGLRNLLLLLWAADPKRPVNENLVTKCVLIRGLVKVALLINSVSDMIRIYSGFGFINYGFPNGSLNIFDSSNKKDVIVIGAGLSGLAAARHLSLLGANVTVLEANNSLDEDGKAIPLKLKTFDCLNEIYGNINNPFSVMANQCDIPMREVSTNLTIFDKNGQIISDDVDQFYQNLVYNFVAYLMEGSTIIRDSSAYKGWSLSDLYNDYRRLRITKEFANNDDVENVYLSEIEYRVCGGASMETISREINMPTMARGMFNFSYKQFSGITAEPVHNWNSLLNKITASVDIRYMTRANSIDKVGEKFSISTNNEEFIADKILLAVSPLNYTKITSNFDWLDNIDDVKNISVDNDEIKSSGTFIIVQMAYDGENLFWRNKIPSQSSETAFAIVPPNPELRGFCHLFKEVREVDGLTILQTRIFGLASKICYKLSDDEIIIKVLDKLSCLSNNPEGAPKPAWYEIIKIENALLSCTDIGIKHRTLKVSQKYENDIFITNKADILAEPISLTNSFCVGMDAASSLIRHVL